jgi:hypothetical protein
MATEGDYTPQEKILAVGPIFALYFQIAMLRSVDSSVRSQWDLLMKGSGFVGRGFHESN